MGRPSPVGNHPIEATADGVLGCDDVLAAALADELKTIDASQGVVAAIMGPCGSGRTSLLNLTAPSTDGAHEAIDFNPWLFSGDAPGRRVQADAVPNPDPFPRS